MSRTSIFGMQPKNGALLLVFVFSALLVGYIGSYFTTPYIPTWYASLIKPELMPPSFVFGPVWSVLYVLMGIAAFRVYLKRKKAPKLASRALLLYGVHLLVNLAWSIVFFAGQNPNGAVAVIALLWSMIIAMVLMFSRIDKPASYLLIPYLAWVTFATYLNVSISMLN